LSGRLGEIIAARVVMDKTKHVLLVGAGADKFATAQKLDIVDPSYFFTRRRWDELQRAKEKDKIELGHDGNPKKTSSAPSETWQADYKFGTVGAVALDRYGNLAAGTSTGGMTNKLYGRVGDSPIIGAGTYADNATAAVYRAHRTTHEILEAIGVRGCRPDHQIGSRRQAWARRRDRS
jgi:beta-aspartyl-peptidase (threonine type)